MNTFLNKHKRQHERKLRQMSSDKPKDYWKFLKSINTSQADNTPPITDFHDYFMKANLSHSDNNVTDGLPDIELNNLDNTCLNQAITIAEITKFISKSKNNKAVSEFDFISNEYLKSTITQMAPLYCLLFIKIDTGVLPE